MARITVIIARSGEPTRHPWLGAIRAHDPHTRYDLQNTRSRGNMDAPGAQSPVDLGPNDRRRDLDRHRLLQHFENPDCSKRRDSGGSIGKYSFFRAGRTVDVLPRWI